MLKNGMLLSILMMGLATLGCSDDSVEVEILPQPAIADLSKTTISVSVWEYDPDIQDGEAKLVAETSDSNVTSPIVVSLDVPDRDSSFSYYVTTELDVDGNGARNCGDYGDTDFNDLGVDASSIRIIVGPVTLNGCPTE
ncbi:MAG: hypothetical protein R3E66_04485 [bacterium]